MQAKGKTMKTLKFIILILLFLMFFSAFLSNLHYTARYACHLAKYKEMNISAEQTQYFNESALLKETIDLCKRAIKGNVFIIFSSLLTLILASVVFSIDFFNKKKANCRQVKDMGARENHIGD